MVIRDDFPISGRHLHKWSFFLKRRKLTVFPYILVLPKTELYFLDGRLLNKFYSLLDDTSKKPGIRITEDITLLRKEEAP